MKSFFALYKNAFGGLSPAAWVLALVMFINRSGTMVIPFLSVYLTSSLGFTIVQTGWIMGAFGLGAISGAFLGGWLTDKIGHFKVQLISLFGGGTMFLLLSQIQEYYPLMGFVFFVSLISEMLRPANQTSVASYARPENVTRAFSLNRMAINLGFSFGPAMGGFLASVSYQWLFVADAVTCFLAGTVFLIFFLNKQPRNTVAPVTANDASEPDRSVWKDVRFLAFIGCVVFFASIFFQLFSTWPIYQREVFQLPEQEIGYLLGLNGMIVFLFEMILVYKIGEKIALRKLVASGTLMVGMAFLTLYLGDHKASLYVACLLISFAEIQAMPFMATYTIQRSGLRNKGAYMGLYSMGFASAFMFAPMIGTNVIAGWDFKTWWLCCCVAAVVISMAFYAIIRPAGAGVSKV